MLPENTYLGELTFLEIYEFFDIPVLFACGNNTGQLFISVWIDETDEDTKWLFAPVSRSRFNALRFGKVDLNEVFLKPEGGFCFLGSIANHTDIDSVTEISANHLTGEMVPQPNSYINDISKLPAVVWDSIDQRSGSSNVIKGWLIKHNYEQNVLDLPSLSRLYRDPKLLVDTGRTYFEFDRFNDDYGYHKQLDSLLMSFAPRNAKANTRNMYHL